eukprot:jgi/Botrbrau1/17061/Bobra.0258s0004.1
MIPRINTTCLNWLRRDSVPFGILRNLSSFQSGDDNEVSPSHPPSAEFEAAPSETPVAKAIKNLIRFGGGPITVAKFMSEALTSPYGGYYSSRPVFGAQGDFITSPEISQLFGEMIGIWCVSLWQDLGCPRRIRLAELGPGRGTLLTDLLRGVSPFTDFMSAVEIHLVEVSNNLREKQAAALGCSFGGTDGRRDWAQAHTGLFERQVKWHGSLHEVPQGAPTLYIAHEFFDALPVHQFQSTVEHGWCERLIDLEDRQQGEGGLRMVLSPGATVAGGLVLRPRMMALPPAIRFELKGIEISPEAIQLAGELARRVHEDDGAALVIDYGKDGPYAESLVAIRGHKRVPLLEQPGLADLSAHVDFDALRYGVQRKGLPVACHGPISQSELLQGLGIMARLEALLEAASSDQEALALISGCERIVGTGSGTGPEGSDVNLSEEQMGSSYKAFCITREGRPAPIPFRLA